jgi:hypothetical protein
METDGTILSNALWVVEELGPLDRRTPARGLHLHSTSALTETGDAVGVLDQQSWARPPRRTSVTAEREKLSKN